MTITMTMEEYLSLQRKAEDYDILVAVAKAIKRNEKKTAPHMFKSDCYNYTIWASEGNIEAMQEQFRMLGEDA